jgi:hypothetical protein
MIIHAELSAVFAECKDPSHAGQRTAHEQLRPILDATALLQIQVATHRQKLLAAELSASNPDHVRGHLERMHQTLDALDTDIREQMRVQRRICLSMCQLERYAGEIETALTRVRLPDVPPVPLPEPEPEPAPDAGVPPDPRRAP